MPDISLRPYQQQFINDVANQFRHGVKRVVGVAPCGAGKTIMTGYIIKKSLDKGKRSIFFVHRQELIKQTSETFNKLDIPHGIICSGFPMQPDLPVQIASVQTLANRLKDVHTPDFLICDECHHILANTYKRILDAFPKAFLLGVTATPQRMGGVTLNDAFDKMVVSLSVNELIKLGNLTPFKYYSKDIGVDLSKVRTVHGEYANSDLANLLIDKKITGGIVEHYQKLANGKSAICYCVNVEHSLTVANAFNAAGIPAAHVDANTPKKERESLVDDFRLGKIKILCNAELFSEGFDVPNCQAVILARPTKSLTLYIQQAMRPLRPDPNNPNKVAIIIDHVKNYARHGLPNALHDWCLVPRGEKQTKCPNCHKWIVPVLKTVEHSIRKFCPNCGYMFQKGEAPDAPPRKAINEEGELEIIDVDFDLMPNNDGRVISKPTTIEELLAIARKKNYRPGWAAFKALYYVNSYEDCLHIADVCGYKKGWAWHKWQDLQIKRSGNNILSNAQFV